MLCFFTGLLLLRQQVIVFIDVLAQRLRHSVRALLLRPPLPDDQPLQAFHGLPQLLGAPVLGLLPDLLTLGQLESQYECLLLKRLDQLPLPVLTCLHRE